MKQIYEKYANDEACVVKMNYATGEIIALVSTPSYDANDLHDLINECSINTLYKQLKDKQTDKINDIIKKSFYDNK